MSRTRVWLAYVPSLESDPDVVLPLGLIVGVLIARAATRQIRLLFAPVHPPVGDAARVLFGLAAGAPFRASAIAGALAASAFGRLTIGGRLRRVVPIPVLRTLVLLTLLLLTQGVLVLAATKTAKPVPL